MPAGNIFDTEFILSKPLRQDPSVDSSFLVKEVYDRERSGKAQAPPGMGNTITRQEGLNVSTE